MADKIEQAKSKVGAWTEQHRHVVAYDEPSSGLMDVASGKSIKLNWRELLAFEEKVHPETKQTYLVLRFEKGCQIALVDPGGIAFPPATENSGPSQALLSVVCLQDYFTLKGRVDHYLFEHPEEPPPRECLDLLMVCIATLDGARAVGFEVGELEKALEKSLIAIERRIS